MTGQLMTGQLMTGMPARIHIALLSGLTAVLLTTGHAAARDSFRFGAWQGSAYPAYGDRFRHCTMSARYRGGSYLMFRITRLGGLQVGLLKPRWSMTRGSRFSMVVSVDGGPDYVGTAVATTHNGVWMRLPSRQWMMQRLRWGHVLRLNASGTTYSYRLTGTALAPQRLMHCVRSELAVEAGRPRPAFAARMPNPAGSRAAAGGTSSRMRLKATTLVANLLNKAGLKDFELVDPDAKPAGMKDYDVVWKGPGVIGGLRIVGRGTQTDAQKLGAALIARDGLACKGKFSSGIKSDRSAKASGAVRLFSVCQTEKSWNALYSIQPLSKGGFVLIVQLALGDLGRLQDADERVFNALPAVLEK
jgi:hypothetical protein